MRGTIERAAHVNLEGTDMDNNRALLVGLVIGIFSGLAGAWLSSHLQEQRDLRQSRLEVLSRVEELNQMSLAITQRFVDKLTSVLNTEKLDRERFVTTCEEYNVALTANETKLRGQYVLMHGLFYWPNADMPPVNEWGCNSLYDGTLAFGAAGQKQSAVNLQSLLEGRKGLAQSITRKLIELAEGR